jgi:MYXO-CTERM domain-containing protein
MSSLTTLLSLAASVLLTVLLPNTVAAYCRMTTGSSLQIGNAACVEEGEPLFWRNTCLSYAIDSRGSQWMSDGEIEEAVDLAFETWENVDCGGAPPNVIFKPLEASTCKRAEFNNFGNVNTVAFLDPWRDPCAAADDPYEPLALAVTIVWRNGNSGEIYDADIMINDQRATGFSAGGPYANCPDTGCPSGVTDLRSVVTHEIGHFIGIGHSDVGESTMFSMNEPQSVEKRTLAQDDIDAVCDTYPPGNLDQLCDATPIGGLRLDCEIDDDGAAFACDPPGLPPGGGGGGCSASQNPGDAPWGPVLAALLGLTAWERRRRAARS